MTTERDSMQALAAEAKETVVLTRQFYSCVVRDPRHASGEFQAVKPANLPRIEEFEAFVAATSSPSGKPPAR